MIYIIFKITYHYEKKKKTRKKRKVWENFKCNNTISNNYYMNQTKLKYNTLVDFQLLF